MTPSRNIGSGANLPLAGAVSGLLALGAMFLFAMYRSGLGFEYPLDDVYIHLSMAEQIARGAYGVNAGEYASAASSPLYPLLLTPFAETGLQRWLPLFWNVLAIAAAGWLFGMALERAGGGRLALPLAIFAPIGLEMYVTAYSSMENMLHGVASLMIVIGLWDWLQNRRLNALLVAGCFLAPAFRLEGLALSLAASGTVFILGGRGAGLMLGALSILPVVVFSGLLLSLGLDPLPNSVMAKLADSSDPELTGFDRRLGRFIYNITLPAGCLLFAVAMALVGRAFFLRNAHPARALFALAVGAAALAHLGFGAIGFMDRYENYILISAVAALVLVLSNVGETARGVAVLAVMALGVLVYMPRAMLYFTWSLAAISNQQGELSRFVKDYAPEPIAVNDLGYMSWRNPNYVLDLWGLASSEALRLRLSDLEGDWATPIVEKKGVELVIIYENWLGDAISPDWIKLGTLNLPRDAVPLVFLGGRNVSFFATTPAAAERLAPALDAWSKDLPPNAVFTAEPA